MKHLNQCFFRLVCFCFFACARYLFNVNCELLIMNDYMFFAGLSVKQQKQQQQPLFSFFSFFFLFSPFFSFFFSFLFFYYSGALCYDQKIENLIIFSSFIKISS